MPSLLEESYPAAVPGSSTTTTDSPDSSAASPPAPSPIDTFQLRREVCGTPTELLIQTFDDRVFVVITQSGKVGCLIQASLPPHVPLPLPISHPSSLNCSPPSLISTATPTPPSKSTTILPSLPPPSPATALTPLLGSPPSDSSALYDLYASQVATLIWWVLGERGHVRRGVVVGLALKRGGAAHGGAGKVDGEALDDAQWERERFACVLEMVAEWTGPQ